MFVQSASTLFHRLQKLTAAIGLPLLLVSMILATVALPDTALAQTVSRGPYLQMGAPTGMTVRWRTNTATSSVVRYGLSANNLPFTAEVAGNRTEHEVALAGLTPATTYFYSVGNSGGPLAGGDADHKFITSPPAGTEQPTRIWVVGDSGTANGNARDVRDAYLTRTGQQYTNLFLMLGDNAYNDGTDNEYQAAVFDFFPTLLRQTPVWPTLGNHDGRSANSNNESGVYYDIFTLPRNGEIGGMRSGTEAYYSFDYANIHFIVLESFETDRSSNGAMMNWLRDDLQAHNQPWVIAFWHHPPYSKGSHDSDSETALVQMRQNALPILEAAGVDLVLGGHSHSYERSFLIDGHYGNSGSFNNAANQVDGGDGRVSGDGAYEKPGDLIGDPNKGAVYVVAGSSGQISGGSLNHRAMRVNLNLLGSMILEVDGNTLDATFLDNNGADRDTFRIVKVPSAPLVTVVPSDPTANELGLGTGTYTLTRSGDTAAAVTVNYTVTGTATSGVDFQPLSGQVNFAANQTTATVDLTPIDDTVVEGDETAILTLSADPAYEVGQPGNATITIVSDEVPPTLTISATTPTAREAGTTQRCLHHYANRRQLHRLGGELCGERFGHGRHRLHRTDGHRNDAGQREHRVADRRTDRRYPDRAERDRCGDIIGQPELRTRPAGQCDGDRRERRGLADGEPGCHRYHRHRGRTDSRQLYGDAKPEHQWRTDGALHGERDGHAGQRL